jgi:hypothetical protein
MPGYPEKGETHLIFTWCYWVGKISSPGGKHMRHRKTFLLTALLAAMLLGAGASANAQVSIGIQIGSPPPPRVVRVLPRRRGPEWIWIEGYWYPVGRRYRWHEGYWTRAPYPGARWIGPRYDGGQYFAGYWDGDRGRFDHDHRWDRDRDRDSDRGRDRR